jgi:hypothetical protein
MSGGSPGYFIQLNTCRSSVDAWTAWALPFRDRRTAVHSQYCRELQEALACLKADGSLRATHTSLRESRAPDVENLLFYNVGVSAFRHLARSALRFERRNAPPVETSTDLGFEARHHVRYEVDRTGQSHPDYTASGACVASSSALCTAAKQVKDVHGLWRAFKTAMVCKAASPRLDRSSFSLQLTISAPARHRLNLADIVKPLTDAFISALHCYQGQRLDEAASRISLRLACPPDTVRELLLNARVALLGPREVPYLRDKGVQWSPADDGLIACEILRETPPGDGSIEVRGRVFSAPLASEAPAATTSFQM